MADSYHAAEQPSASPDGDQERVDARSGRGEGGAGAAVEAREPSLVRVVPAVVIAWAIPGLGHVLLRRVGRGLLFGAIVLALFAGGIALEGKVYRPQPEQPLSYLAALGAAGVGAPYAVAHTAGYASGDVESAYHDYGNTFTLVAGLLNLLLVLDAFDIAVGRR